MSISHIMRCYMALRYLQFALVYENVCWQQQLNVSVASRHLIAYSDFLLLFRAIQKNFRHQVVNCRQSRS